MSNVLPDKDVDQLQFCEAHYPIWATAPAAIGLSAQAVTDFQQATKACRTAYNAALAARQASKAATTTSDAAFADMRNRARDLIRQVKAFADLQTNPSAVYAAAQIPEPSGPTPAQAPGQATDIEVKLESTGAVTLLWSATNASASSGAFYNITRKLPGQSNFVPIGGAPGTTSQSRRMSFTDVTIPTTAASSGAQYIITPRRGLLTGEPSGAITVQFGVDGEGSFAIGTVGKAVKLAA